MSTNEHIYGLRKQLGLRRQSAFEPVMLQLDAILQRNGRAHPYSFDRQTLTELMTVGTFASGCGGSSARVRPSDYLYHLTSVAKLRQELIWQQPDPTSDDRLFHSALIKAAQTRDWVSVGAFAQGTYSGFRRMTWWTTLDLAAAPATNPLRVGLPDNWIPTYAVIMRTRPLSVASGKVTVPTVVDGYLSSIFHPTLLDPQPDSGVTIDLNTENLEDGVDEYLLNAVPVTHLEMKPILLDAKARSTRSAVLLQNGLLDRLARYYGTLL